MKIIISHDVDHLYLSDHWRDAFLPGLALRSLKSCLRGQLSISAIANRFSFRMNRINELQAFNQRHHIPATYFFGMRTGLKLSYHWRTAKEYVRFLQDSGNEIGLHGMAYNDVEKLREEKKRLEEILELPVEGIRNHYLRLAESTLPTMAKLGFKFDSTQTGLDFPSKCGELTEIPISLMDVQLMKKHPCNLKVWMEESWSRIKESEFKDIPYFVINFHDVYFSGGYLTFKSWYENLVVELKKRDYEFITFRTALDELAQ